jgi:hypothetical protein
MNSLILSGVAAGILVIERGNTIERWNLVWLNSDTPIYSSNEHCYIVNFYPANCPRTCHPTTETTTANTDTINNNNALMKCVIPSDL